MGSATRTRYIEVMDKKTLSGITVDEVVVQVTANARLEGGHFDKETVDVVRRIAAGEMTKEDAAEWRKARAEVAARRFEQATADLAAEERFGGPDAATTEIEIVDEAAALVAEAKDFDPLARFGLDRDEVRAKLLASNEIEVLLEDMGIVDPAAAALLEVPVGDVRLEDLVSMIERLRTDAAG